MEYKWFNWYAITFIFLIALIVSFVTDTTLEAKLSIIFFLILSASFLSYEIYKWFKEEE